MPALSDFRLRALLVGALPGSVVIEDPGHTKPIVLDVPQIGPIRIYLWTTTADASATGRPLGEHKAQIILPGSPRGSRQHLNLQGMPVALLGYSPVFGVFTAWQAERHSDSGYSKNLQFREEVLQDGQDSGWGIDRTRMTERGPEVRAAIHPLHLARFLNCMVEADTRDLQAQNRRDYYIGHAPNIVPLPDAEEPEENERERQRVLARRLERNPQFSGNVLTQFDFQCAICAAQLTVVEGAHIIPVHDARSRDEIWNGIGLCRNHHRLFDTRVIRINPDGVVHENPEEIEYLRSTRLIGGYETLVQPFNDQRIHLPRFWRDVRVRGQFQDALRIVSELSEGP